MIGKPLCDMNKFYIEYETRVQLSECPRPASACLLNNIFNVSFGKSLHVSPLLTSPLTSNEPIRAHLSGCCVVYTFDKHLLGRPLQRLSLGCSPVSLLDRRHPTL